MKGVDEHIRIITIKAFCQYDTDGLMSAKTTEEAFEQNDSAFRIYPQVVTKEKKKRTTVAPIPIEFSHSPGTYSTKKPQAVFSTMPDIDSGMNRMPVVAGERSWTS